MPDPSRTAARDLFTQAAEAGVAPLLLGGSPWAVRKDLLERLAEAARMPPLAGVTMKAAAPATETVTAGVAVIPLTGVITPQGSFFDFLFGGSGGLLAFREAFSEAVNSPDVSAILIDVDSPGGLVDLVPETAAMIRAARGAKPIVAIADTLMASAAYWIAAQADEIVCTPSGYAGSVGVYRVHYDYSRWNSEAGVAVTYVYAGEHKVEGNMDEPLDADAQAQWQQDVDDAYAMFVADVAAGRGVSTDAVIADYGQGRCLNAQRALSAGIVDRVATYDEVLAGLLGREPTGATSAMTGIDFKAALAELVAGQTLTPNQARALFGISPEENGPDDGRPVGDPPGPDELPASDAAAAELSAEERAVLAAAQTAR